MYCRSYIETSCTLVLLLWDVIWPVIKGLPKETHSTRSVPAIYMQRQRCAIQPVACAIDFPGYETGQRSYVSKVNRAETKQKAHGQQRRNERRCGRMPRCKQTHEIEQYAEQTYTAASSYIRSVYWQHPISCGVAQGILLLNTAPA
jgi:hypothetical protein